nr:3-ketoacyl-CoA synthase 12-like [Ipomoea batatas]
METAGRYTFSFIYANAILVNTQCLLRAVVNSGIGEETYLPWNVLEGREDSGTLADGIEEVEECFFDTLEKLFVKSGVSPAEIDVLVVNVSMLSPAPSLCSRIVQCFAMREDVSRRLVENMHVQVASGREIIGRVAAGAVAKKILKQIAATESNIVGCPNPEHSEKMIAAINGVREIGDSAGGVVTCIIKNGYQQLCDLGALAEQPFRRCWPSDCFSET